MASPGDIEWIAVDWGTTNLRAWAMAGGMPVAAISAPDGMAALARDQFEPALLKAVGPWLEEGRSLDVVACGMVGARQGWVEVLYAPVPSPPLVASAMWRVESQDPRMVVTIVHGLSQALPPDVMRGEETQIAGLLALRPGFEGSACLPGTHSKWATVRAGRVERFRTFMTGELFALLATQSILRHSVGEAGETDLAVFENGVREAMGEPAAAAAHLFSIRAAGLVGDATAPASRARLSGLLIGLEVEAMRDALAGEVVLIGQSELASLYARAIALAGGESSAIDATECTLAGLAAAQAMLEAQA